ncbi:MAG: NADH-quinone oxidoreductase subunit N [Pseudomonadota bacterium]|nr:NADH-quinone oxidoreductase subunit N [Pseudomonadota bacterium]
MFKISDLDLAISSPFLILFLFSLIPITQRVFRKSGEQSMNLSVGYGILGFLSAMGAVLANKGIYSYAFKRAGLQEGSLIHDGIYNVAAMLVLILGIATLLFLRENIATATERFAEKVFLVMNAAVGMLIVLSANDLIVMFIGIETMSLAIYILIALSREEFLAKEAAFKYFILGSFATAIFLLGVAYVFGAAKTTMLSQIMEVSSELFKTNGLFFIGVILVILGLCFKISVFPFHAWTPDVYQGAPTPITTFMAAGVKLVGFVALLRFILCLTGIEKVPQLLNLLQWLAVFTMLAGNVAAIVQDNLKRMLAYSSVAHTGYLLIGIVAIAMGRFPIDSTTGFLFYLYSYFFMTIGSFAIIGIFESHEGKSVTIEDLKGLATRHPYTSLIFSVFLLSLAGIPPLLGFFGKFYLLSVAVQSDLYWLAFWGVISSVIGAYYYLRPIVYMYMVDGNSIVLPKQYMTKLILWLSAFSIALLGLTSAPLYRGVERSIKKIFSEQSLN